MSVSCSFTECRTPAYARWYRPAHFLNADERVLTTFLACQEHDARLAPYDGGYETTGIFRIGLVADEVCWHRSRPLITETRYGVRLFLDSTEDRFEDMLDLTRCRAEAVMDYHRAKIKLHTGWRVTKVVLLTQRVDVHPWLEHEEEEVHGR